jgi:2-polyprenyl-3-methyl-5-hydroxy-6-metoxy-1,4-benzoquinol methylase
VGSVKQHYDEMLGPVYSWILGDFEKAHDANTDLFAQLSVAPRSGAKAIDLGCGPGCQSIPLAQLGYNVTAIDFCENLLQELNLRAADLPIKTVCDDLLNFRAHVDDPDLIVCMGDTLVHLPGKESVEVLIDMVADALHPGGHFIATLRDYSTPPLTGADRFIPIRGGDEQVFTCFLEYAEDSINVHDILHEKKNGEWGMTVSSYQKLLLDYRHVAARLHDRGLDVADPWTSGGMVVLKARKTG